LEEKEKEKHRATIGVFAIPQDKEGKGLWSQRRDGKGINAIGGTVDPEDAKNAKTLSEVLKREFAVAHFWMDPCQIVEAAERYDEGDKASGLLSGRGKRQWQMAKAFFIDASQNPEFRKIALSEM